MHPRLKLCIDPGNTESAYVLYERGTIHLKAKVANIVLLEVVACYPHAHLVIEMIASYGMPVGEEVFETVLWAGRFIQAHRASGGKGFSKAYRKDIKMLLCGSTAAKDRNVRQALIDRFGPGKDRAIGLKKAPGPLYGFSADLWSALAVAVYAEAMEAQAPGLVESLQGRRS